MKPRRARVYEVTWAIGIPQSGKTTLAVSRAIQRAEERGVPLVAIDSGAVDQLRGLPPAETPGDVVQIAFREHRSCRYVPSDLEDCERVLRVLRKGRRLVVLVDEAHYWLSAHTDGTSSELVHLMREGQHARTDLFLTTHHLTGDVPQAALTCTSRVLVLRCIAPRVLDLLSKEWGFDRGAVQSLPQFHYLEKRLGFA